MHRPALPVFACFSAFLCFCAMAADDKVLCDFESPDGLKIIEGHKNIQLVTEHATQGQKSGKVGPGFTLACGEWTGLPKDWSAFDQLKLDIFNPGEPGDISYFISDENDENTLLSNFFRDSLEAAACFGRWCDDHLQMNEIRF